MNIHNQIARSEAYSSAAIRDEEDNRAIEPLVSSVATAAIAAASSPPCPSQGGSRGGSWMLPTQVLINDNPFPQDITFDTCGRLVVTFMNYNSPFSPQKLIYSRDPARHPIEELDNHRIKVTLADGNVLIIQPICCDKESSLSFVQAFKKFATYEGSVEDLPKKVLEAWRGGDSSSSALQSSWPRSEVGSWSLPIEVLINNDPFPHYIKFDRVGRLVVTVMNYDSPFSPQNLCYSRDPARYPIEELGKRRIKVTLAGGNVLIIEPTSCDEKSSLGLVRAFKKFATYEGPVEELPKKALEAWRG